jgi:hypothetical protein
MNDPRGGVATHLETDSPEIKGGSAKYRDLSGCCPDFECTLDDPSARAPLVADALAG